MNDDARKVRELVARYSAEGVAGMSEPDVRLFLAEKQRHLMEVSGRCADGQELHVNVPLRRALEGEVLEIGRAADFGHGLPEDSPKAHGHATWEGLAREIRQDEAARKREEEHGRTDTPRGRDDGREM